MKSSWRETFIFTLLLLLTLPAVSLEPDSVSFTYPREANHLLLFARQTRQFQLCNKLETHVTTYRLFGDGRLELDPAPDWLREEPIVLEPEIREQLLHSLDALLDLGAHHLDDSQTEADSFVEVHLDRYVSPRHAIYYLDARIISELDAVFAELATLKRWLIERAARQSDRVIFISGNPWPPSCQEDRRRALGHRVLEPIWCSPPAFSKPAPGQGVFDGDTDEREAIRERMRERLRALPRGLSPSAACGFGHAHRIESALHCLH